MIKQLNINKMKNLKYKMMKKLVFALLMLLTLSMNAQEKDVVKFMGIPVDGTKSEMISQLKKKGFTYNRENDWMEGRFNGEQVEVIVHTNNDIVDRIMVVTANPVSETDIKIKFNNLVRQFENNEKYFSSDEDQLIGDDVDISYEMSVKSKRFEASFHQCYTKAEVEEIKQMFYNNYDVIMENMANSPELKEAGISFDGNKEDNVSIIAAIYGFSYIINNDVWFMISESKIRYNYYNINIFYDNLYNRPNGEDL